MDGVKSTEAYGDRVGDRGFVLEKDKWYLPLKVVDFCGCTIDTSCCNCTNCCCIAAAASTPAVAPDGSE
jgi:hypothetical protein